MASLTNARWHPAPVIKVSIALHAAAAVGLALQPSLWPWAVLVVGANQIVLIGATLWPRERLLGPNLIRLPEAAARRSEVSLSFDDGPDPDVTPRVLELLDRYDAKASFFLIGAKAAAHPQLVNEIARRGHSIENHTERHPHAFACYGLRRLRREVAAAQATITALSGQPPLYFRAPAGFRSPLLDPVLSKLGLRYASWTRRGYDAVSADPARVLARLIDGLAAGDMLLLHDGSHARTQDGVPVVIAVLPALLDRIQNQGLKSVTLRAACADAA